MRRTPVPAALALFLTLAACGSDTVGSGQAGASCPEAAVPLCTDPGYTARVEVAIADAVARIAPSLSAGVRDALLPDLEALAVALDARDVTDGTRAAADLRVSLASERGSASSDDLPSLDAIALAVIQAELVLGVVPSPLSRVSR
jgi:hypothetical protein